MVGDQVTGYVSSLAAGTITVAQFQALTSQASLAELLIGVLSLSTGMHHPVEASYIRGFDGYLAKLWKITFSSG